MEWTKYYEKDRIIPLEAQSIYYSYALEQFKCFILENKTDSEQVVVALGGIHPKVTRPNHFENIYKDIFPPETVCPVIIDQNKEALADLPSEKTSLIHSKLESLPQDFPLISALICDYTFDFMSDYQLQEFNNTFPSHLDNNGLMLLTVKETTFPMLMKVEDRLFYSVSTYYHKISKLVKALDSFKLVYAASTANKNNLLIFSHKNSVLDEHTGTNFLLDPEIKSPFQNWLIGRHCK